MRIITYLAFTLLSILVQFCFMDFIQEKVREDKRHDLNITSRRKHLSDVVKEISPKSYALYYRTERSILLTNSSAKLYSNLSFPDITSTTDVTTTVFEVYDDNDVSSTDTLLITETTTTEIENITETNFFEHNNQSSAKPNIPKTKISLSKDCSCNLLYRICDINCCCDTDCSESDIKMFLNCIERREKVEKVDINYCYPDSFMGHKQQTGFIDNLFCVVKTNLPDKRYKSPLKDKMIPFHSYMWHRHPDILTDMKHEFVKKSYEYNDPLWLLKNGSIYYMDLPSNNYCTSRKPVHFLREENIHCIVKFKELEMFRVLKLIEGSVISVTEHSMNASDLNCTSLNCVNWTVIACDALSCMNYNKTLHEPVCTESFCKNLAPRLDYVFYYHSSKIMNATMTLHLQDLVVQQFIQQSVHVKFVLANESVDNIIKLSGNPGYVNGLPVIVSFAKSNHSEAFFNTSEGRYLAYPDNVNGHCVFTNTTRKLVLFGRNKRNKCRYTHANIKMKNYTELCKSVQNNVSRLLGLQYKVVISPYGNPQSVTDQDWIPMSIDLSEKDIVYGIFDNKSSKFHCYNLITRISLIFTFDDIIDGHKDQNRILFVKTDTTSRNISFNTDDISTVITVDTSFPDGSKPSVFEYAGIPHLNIHLPQDFFFPFPSNESHLSYYNLYCILCCSFILVVCK